MRNTTLVIYLLMFGFGSLFIPTASGQLIISEFRLRGPSGASDEFIEIYNNSGADHTVNGGGTGYAIAASNGLARCIIPDGTVIPNRGHYLCVNSVAYSLSSYPAGNGTTATGDATYTSEIPDNAGIALFNTSIAANFNLGNRMDAVGSTSEANNLYREGTGYPALSPFSIDYSFQRDECGKSGSITTLSLCSINGPRDTNNNATNFIFVDTNGTSAGAGQRLGAPGPENLSSPISPSRIEPSFDVSSLDSCVSPTAPPNRLRDFTSDPGNNSTFGTIEFRLKVRNNTGGNITKLRFRVVDLTTFPAPSGIADLRPRTSGATVVTTDDAPCGSGTSNVTVEGTTLEAPPNQPNGGGFNSSMGTGTISVATPLAPGASEDFRLLMGIQQTGTFKLGIYVETVPGGGTFHYFIGDTQNPTTVIRTETPFDFGTDERTDASIYRPSTGQWWIRNSNNASVTIVPFGLATDTIVPGDYSGDGIVDRAVFRPSSGQWLILRSENLSLAVIPFGLATDIPAPGDYDGDGRTDLAVFRQSNSVWYIQRTSDNILTTVGWGVSTDRPVPADYDGDRKTDVAIWRPSGGGGGGEWWARYSGNGQAVSVAFGSPTDRAVAGDYTGDGRADFAFWRPSTGFWYVLRSEDFSFYAFPFGVSTDRPVLGDYDGDGKNDAAVFRPSTGQWFLSNSGNGSTTIFGFGVSTDQTVPGAYVQ